MKAAVAVLISDKLDFKIRNKIRDEEGYFIMIKGLIHYKDMSPLNVYAAINGSSKEMKQTLASTAALSVIDRTARQKQNKTGRIQTI